MRTLGHSAQVFFMSWGAPTSQANRLESDQGEVRSILLLGTSVNNAGRPLGQAVPNQ